MVSSKAKAIYALQGDPGEEVGEGVVVGAADVICGVVASGVVVAFVLAGFSHAYKFNASQSETCHFLPAWSMTHRKLAFCKSG